MTVKCSVPENHVVIYTGDLSKRVKLKNYQY